MKLLRPVLSKTFFQNMDRESQNIQKSLLTPSSIQGKSRVYFSKVTNDVDLVSQFHLNNLNNKAKYTLQTLRFAIHVLEKVFKSDVFSCFERWKISIFAKFEHRTIYSNWSVTVYLVTVGEPTVTVASLLQRKFS